MRLFSFLARRDKVEVLTIFLGGLVVVVFAFFMARGDLDAYVEVLLKGGLPGEEVPISGSFSLERFDRSVGEEFVQETESLEEWATSLALPVETPPSETVIVSEKPVIVTTPRPASTPSPPAGSQGGKFFVQVGAFSKESNAQGMVATLKNLGYSATVERVSSLYRVRIYGFASMEEAQRVANRLKAQGIESFAGK